MRKFAYIIFIAHTYISDPEKALRRAKIKERKQSKAGGAFDPMETVGLDDPLVYPSDVPLTKEHIKKINQKWEDNAVTSKLFEMIKTNDLDSLALVLENQPAYAHIRSKDGRGPMWWAHEHGRKEVVSLLKGHGVSEKFRDKDGMTPLDLADDEF